MTAFSVLEVIPKPINITGETAQAFNPDELLALSIAIYDAKFFNKLTDVHFHGMELTVWALNDNVYFKDYEGTTVFLTWRYGTQRELGAYQLYALANALVLFFMNGVVSPVNYYRRSVKVKPVRTAPKRKYVKASQRIPANATAEEKKALFFAQMQELHGDNPKLKQCPHCGCFYTHKRFDSHVNNIHFQRKVGESE